MFGLDWETKTWHIFYNNYMGNNIIIFFFFFSFFSSVLSSFHFKNGFLNFHIIRGPTFVQYFSFVSNPIISVQAENSMFSLLGVP